jgi:hypothetical protein
MSTAHATSTWLASWILTCTTQRAAMTEVARIAPTARRPQIEPIR